MFGADKLGSKPVLAEGGVAYSRESLTSIGNQAGGNEILATP